MRVSMKVDYGVRALIDLAQNYNKGPIQTSEIARRQGVPEPYLDQLLTTLRKSGLIHSRRGPQGGHNLAKEPQSITLGEVISTLEGTLHTIDCLDGTYECSLAGSCSQQEIWRDIDLQTRNLLNTTTIGTLASKQKPQETAAAAYYI